MFPLKKSKCRMQICEEECHNLKSVILRVTYEMTLFLTKII